MEYTYERRFTTRLGARTVNIPDQVAADQVGYDERQAFFPAWRPNGTIATVRLDGVAARAARDCLAALLRAEADRIADVARAIERADPDVLGPFIAEED